MKKYTLYASFLFFSVLIMTSVRAEEKWLETTKEWNFLDYRINILTKRPENSVTFVESTATIFRNGQLIKEIEGGAMSLSVLGYLRFIGNEVKPYLILYEDTGGMHCCTNITGFELSPTLKEIFNLSGQRGEISVASAQDGHSIKMYDGSFRYWHECFALSANVPIEFTISNNKNSADLLAVISDSRYVDEETEQTRVLIKAKELYDNKDLWQEKTWRGGLREEDTPYHYPGPVTEEVVKLIYRGRPQLANKFLDAAWNPKNPYKEEFKKDLKILLQTNDTWKGLYAQGYKLPF